MAIDQTNEERVSLERQKAILSDRKEFGRQIYASIVLTAYIDLCKEIKAKNAITGDQVELIRSRWRADCDMAAMQALEAVKVFEDVWKKKKAIFISNPS